MQDDQKPLRQYPDLVLSRVKKETVFAVFYEKKAAFCKRVGENMVEEFAVKYPYLFNYTTEVERKALCEAM